jgi:hypothetical protein
LIWYEVDGGECALTSGKRSVLDLKGEPPLRLGEKLERFVLYDVGEGARVSDFEKRGIPDAKHGVA